MGRRKVRKGCLFVLILIIIAIGAAVAYGKFFSTKDLVPERSVAYRDDRINVLVIGTDRGADSPNDTGRADSIMVFNLDLKNKKVNALSIPRDSRVEIPGRENKTKINHSYAYGGVDLTKETVENLLGIPIDYYAETNFAGFEQIVDTLGGVEIDVPIRMKTHTYYGDIDLEPGLQTLNGQEALGFVRYRYDAGGDIARAERQQQFLKAVFEKTVSGSNILKLPELLPQILEAVDTDFSTTQLITLAKEFREINLDTDLHTEVLAGDSETIGGASYWLIDEDAMQETVQRLFIDDYAEPAETGQTTEE